MFRLALLCSFVFITFGGASQKTAVFTANFRIIDIAHKEIRLLNQYKNADSLTRSKVFADSLYTPYQSFWSGYVGDASDFVGWFNEKVVPKAAAYNARNQQLDGIQLQQQFDEVKTGMKALTGYNPVGEWYVVYGPGWTNLGGLSGGTMLIDLSHGSNTSNAAIMMMFPHELTHQIYSNVNKHTDTTAISSIIGEGFAVYMNGIYWKDKYSVAQNLGYTEAEMQACAKEDATIRAYFEKHKYDTGREAINVFRSRGEHLKETLPGAIGYYIGYQIVERYVQRFGKGSWKDVFTKSPREIYEASGY